MIAQRILLIGFLGLWFCGVNTPLAWGQTVFQQAEQLRAQYQYHAANSLLQEYITAHPSRRNDAARAWWMISYNLLQQGDLAGAEMANDTSLALRAATLSDEIAENYLRRGGIALQRGDYRRALAALDRAADLPIEDPRLYALVMAYRGQALTELGQWEQAEQAFNDAHDALAIAGGEAHPDLATLYYDQARLYLRQGRHNEASELLRASLRIAQDHAGQPDLVGRAHNALGLWAETHAPEAATRHYQEALAALTQAYGAHHRELGRVHLNLARWQATAAGRHLAAAVQSLCPRLPAGELPNATTFTLDRPLLAEALRRLAWQWVQAGAADSVRQGFELGSAAAEVYLTHLSTLSEEGVQLRYRQGNEDVFEPGIFGAFRLKELTGDPHWLERAFDLAECGKGALLRAQQQLALRDPALDGLRRALRRTEAEAALRPHDQAAAAAARDAYALWQSALDVHRLLNPQEYATYFVTPMPPVAELQEQLKEGQATLSYYLGAQHYYLFCLTREGFTGYMLAQDYHYLRPNGKNTFLGRLTATAAEMNSGGGVYSKWTVLGQLPPLRESVTEMLRAVRKNDANLYAAHAANLHVKLLYPVRKELRRINTLTIVPHGELTAIPFEGLVEEFTQDEEEGNDKTISFHKLNYLGASYRIGYQYAVYDTLVGTATRPSARWLGVAPVFAEADAYGALSETARDRLPLAESNQPEAVAETRTFAPLPFSESEVQLIAGKYGPRGQLLLHEAATEAALLDSIAHFGLVHLATHSFVNPESAQWSGIALARQPASRPTEDGILYAAELASLALHGQLVVLSSCESGRGPDAGGEGPQSLARALLVAGASEVVASLWKVYDRHTATLMDYFYEGILKGESATEAMHAAQQKFRRNKATANPRFWAGFVVIGR